MNAGDEVRGSKKTEMVEIVLDEKGDGDFEELVFNLEDQARSDRKQGENARGKEGKPVRESESSVFF